MSALRADPQRKPVVFSRGGARRCACCRQGDLNGPKLPGLRLSSRAMQIGG
jgi:hypothetical protein